MDDSTWRKIIEEDIQAIRELHRASAEQSATVELDQPSVGRLSRMDTLQQQAMANANNDRRRQRLVALQAALKRLQNQEFGDCLGCGEPIPEPRLRLDPCVSYCVTCAETRNL